MRKEIQSSLIVKRLSSSPYYSESFISKEKKTLEALKGITYLDTTSSATGQILITNTHTKVDELSQTALEHCQLMIHANSGYDNFSVEFVQKAHFPIVSGNSIRAQAVANYILSALLHHYSALPEHKNWDTSRKWKRKILKQSHIQIIGYGHIGQILDESLKPLVNKISIFDPDKSLKEIHWDQADVIILVCSLNPTSQNILNKSTLSLLKEDFLVINAARGGLVDFEELTNILQEKPKAKAFIDVFPKEPFDIASFSHLPNLKMTSHIAGVYDGLEEETLDFEKKIIENFLSLSLEKFNKKYQADILSSRIRGNFLL